MALRIAVHPHVKVVLVATQRHSKVQIATLEVRIEPQLIFLGSWVHSHEESILRWTQWIVFFLLGRVEGVLADLVFPIYLRI